MKSEHLFVSMRGGIIEYHVMMYKNHYFRLYPDGHIGKIDESDEEAIQDFVQFHEEHKRKTEAWEAKKREERRIESERKKRFYNRFR